MRPPPLTITPCILHIQHHDDTRSDPPPQGDPVDLPDWLDAQSWSPILRFLALVRVSSWAFIRTTHRAHGVHTGMPGCAIFYLLSGSPTAILTK